MGQGSIIGYEINEKTCQISFYNEKDLEPDTLEVVLTGRNPDEALLALADYVTEMKLRKHPYERGITARRMIEW